WPPAPGSSPPPAPAALPAPAVAKHQWRPGPAPPVFSWEGGLLLPVPLTAAPHPPTGAALSFGDPSGDPRSLTGKSPTSLGIIITHGKIKLPCPGKGAGCYSG